MKNTEKSKVSPSKFVRSKKLATLVVVGIAGAAVADFASDAMNALMNVTDTAHAQGADSDELFVGGEVSRAPAAVRNSVSRKRYAGGADEDDLQVQETLPIPTRNFDGVAASAAAESSPAESSEPPPSND